MPNNSKLDFIEIGASEVWVRNIEGMRQPADTRRSYAMFRSDVLSANKIEL